MVLDIPGNLFGDRDQVEGTSPSTYDIDWTEERTQDISKALAMHILTFGTSHTVNGGAFLNATDEDLTTKWNLGNINVGATTTTIILDLGVDIHVHNTIMLLALDAGAISLDNTVTTSYSSEELMEADLVRKNFLGIKLSDLESLFTR